MQNEAYPFDPKHLSTMRNEWVFLSERSVWWCDVIKGRKGKERRKRGTEN
jgi:hypothetical protein